MAKFEFYQDKQVKTWIRDYFTIEAETLEDAIAFLEEQNDCLENLENDHPSKVEFSFRDTDIMYNSFDEHYPTRYGIYSVDLKKRDEDYEIIYK